MAARKASRPATAFDAVREPRGIDQPGRTVNTKTPFQSKYPSSHAKNTDPQTWSEHAVAVEAVEAGRADGIGFVLSDCEIAAFDLDDCRNPETGEVAEWALELVDQARSYVEATVSGTGLRILGRAIGDHVHRLTRPPCRLHPRRGDSGMLLCDRMGWR